MVDGGVLCLTYSTCIIVHISHIFFPSIYCLEVIDMYITHVILNFLLFLYVQLEHKYILYHTQLLLTFGFP